MPVTSSAVMPARSQSAQLPARQDMLHRAQDLGHHLSCWDSSVVQRSTSPARVAAHSWRTVSAAARRTSRLSRSWSMLRMRRMLLGTEG